MSEAGKRILAGLEDALRFARGEDIGARVTIVERPDARTVRKRLKMTQEEFAQNFSINLATLRNWEQGTRLPDGPARVLLAVIDKEPEAVRRALASSMRRATPKELKQMLAKNARRSAAARRKERV